MEPIRLWAVVRRHQHIEKDGVRVMAGLILADAKEALGELCREMDIERPMWLSKHENDWLKYHRTTFKAEHFIDHFPYDRLEIEAIVPGEKKKKVDLRYYP